jgi:ankyrin repeat protein
MSFLAVLHDLARKGNEADFNGFFMAVKSQFESYNLSSLLNRRSELRYTPLHIALFSRFAIETNKFIMKVADTALNIYLINERIQKFRCYQGIG